MKTPSPCEDREALLDDEEPVVTLTLPAALRLAGLLHVVSRAHGGQLPDGLTRSIDEGLALLFENLTRSRVGDDQIIDSLGEMAAAYLPASSIEDPFADETDSDPAEDWD